MKSRIAVLTVITIVAALMGVPAHLHGQQTVDPKAHEEHHPDAAANQPAPTVPAQPNMAAMSGMMSRMKANDAKLDDLVKKMNAATGAAKADAIAAVRTPLVEDRKHNCEPMMANMMSMMGGNGGRMGPPASK